jgi:hypothetical protein
MLLSGELRPKAGERLSISAATEGAANCPARTQFGLQWTGSTISRNLSWRWRHAAKIIHSLTYAGSRGAILQR